MEAVTWLIGSRGRIEMIYADAVWGSGSGSVWVIWNQCESVPACSHWERPLKQWFTAASGWVPQPRSRLNSKWSLENNIAWYGLENKKLNHFTECKIKEFRFVLVSFHLSNSSIWPIDRTLSVWQYPFGLLYLSTSLK